LRNPTRWERDFAGIFPNLEGNPKPHLGKHKKTSIFPKGMFSRKGKFLPQRVVIGLLMLKEIPAFPVTP